MVGFNNTTDTYDPGRGKALFDTIYCYSVLVWRVYLTKHQHLIMSICLGLTIIPIVLLNFALSFALYKTGEYRNKSKFFVFLLSMSDMLVGLVTVPAHVVFHTVLSSQRCCWFERLYLFVGQSNGHFSFYSLMVIALERYLHITAALRYGVESRGVAGKLTRLTLTNKGHCSLLFLMVVCSIFHGLVPTYFFGTVRSNLPNIAMVFVRYVIFVAIYILYIRVYFAIRRHVRKNQPLNKKHSEVFRTVITILIAYTVCYMPCVVTDCWVTYYSYVLNSSSPIALRFANYLSFTLVYLNGAINAAILLKANKRALAYNYKLLSVICPFLSAPTTIIGQNSIRL